MSAVLPSPAGGTGTWGIIPDIEEGVVLEGAPGRVLLVPEDSGTSVTWRTEPMARPLPPLDAAHARRQVHAATEEAIEALVELDLARERPEMADALNDLLTAVVDPRLVPPWLSHRDRELLERSLRLAGMCELALDGRRCGYDRPSGAAASRRPASAAGGGTSRGRCGHRVVGPVEGARHSVAYRWGRRAGTDPAQPWARTQL